MSLKLDPSAAKYMEMIDHPPAGTPFTPPDISGLRMASASTEYAVQTQELESIKNIQIDGPYGQIDLRLFKPKGIAPDALASGMVYIHGGGWVIGGLDDFAPVCNFLAEKSKSIVIAINYRLAPEYPFPVAPNEVIHAWEWVTQNTHSLGIDADRLSIAGDSAGANMAAVCAIDARNKKGIQPKAQILFYPVTDQADEMPSYARANGETPLSADEMRWYRNQYLCSREEALNWKASPLRAQDLAGLPRTFIVTVGHDPLCDEGIAYARRLQNEGVLVTHVHLSGIIHGFLRMAKIIQVAAPVMEFAAAFQKSI